MGEMIGKEVLETEGKTILKISAFDHIGYDRGIICEFDDGSWLEIRPISIIQGPDARIEFEFKKGPDDDMKRDLCRCGSILKWNEDDKVVTCEDCKTKYKVEGDDRFMHWLEESFEDRIPWITSAK